ncbi:MAG: hypothetical protein OEY44_04575 [Candidatus Peregrinibacteria bacterium]|nr:hypothetical protein [Candidatus Peregrinibacteria bacterium]
MQNSAPKLRPYSDSESPGSGIRSTRNSFQGIFSPQGKSGLLDSGYSFSDDGTGKLRESGHPENVIDMAAARTRIRRRLSRN